MQVKNENKMFKDSMHWRQRILRKISHFNRWMIDLEEFSAYISKYRLIRNIVDLRMLFGSDQSILKDRLEMYYTLSCSKNWIFWKIIAFVIEEMIFHDNLFMKHIITNIDLCIWHQNSLTIVSKVKQDEKDCIKVQNQGRVKFSSIIA